MDKENVLTKEEILNESLEDFYKRLFPLGWEFFVDAHKSMNEMELPKAVVYVLEMENNTVKIGMTKDIERRIKQLRGICGVKIKREWHTDTIPRKYAHMVEHLCHDEFKEQRTLGEYFNVAFDEATFAVALYTIIVIEGEKYKAEHGIKRKY